MSRLGLYRADVTRGDKRSPSTATLTPGHEGREATNESRGVGCDNAGRRARGGGVLPYFTANPGNPSSIHQARRAALEALDDARETVAAVLGASLKEIIFTGDGS